MDSDRFIRECPILFKKYKVKKKIGQGAFGAVFLGQRIIDNKYVAIKVEKRKIQKPLLESEAYLLSQLKGLGIPKVISFGKTKFYTVLIEPLFGKTLFDIFIENGKQFHLEELSLIALQVIERLETIHAQYVIHRDIKPDNFIIGREDPNIIYLLDFGLSKRYRSLQTGRHVKFRNTGKLTGTLRFASPNALRGGEQSRKDDLISAGYMLIYLLKRKLPWQVIKALNSTDKYIKIYRMKKSLKPEHLCQNLPKEMTEYMKYVQNLGFESNPDYNYLKKLFHHILKTLNLNADKLLFSWIKQSDIKKLKKKANPNSRNSSPQSRLYKKIRDNLQKKRDASSSDSSENNSYEVIPKIINHNANIPMQRNYSKDNFENSDMTKLTSKNNTIFVNFDKTINNKLEKVFENIDKQLDSKDTSNDKNDGILSQKTAKVANKLNNNEESESKIPPLTQNIREKFKNLIPQEINNIDEYLKELKGKKDNFYNQNKILSNDDINKNNELNKINNYLGKKNSGEQLRNKNSLDENMKEKKQPMNMGSTNKNDIITPEGKKLKNNGGLDKKIKNNNGIMNQNLNDNSSNIPSMNNNNLNTNMNMKEKVKLNKHIDMNNPKVKKINPKKLNSGNMNGDNLINNNKNYCAANTDHNEESYDVFNNNQKYHRNMEKNLFGNNNNNSNNHNFITYTEPSNPDYNDYMQIHKVQTEPINDNKNAFQIFKAINNDLCGNNDYNLDSNKLKSNNNMNQYNKMNKNFLMNNKNKINGINGINDMNKQMEPKVKCKKIHKNNNNNLRKTNQIMGNINNMNYNGNNMNINLNMGPNNKMMINRNINGNRNQINNNLNNPYNNQGMNRQNRMMVNNNYFPNNNMMPNNNFDFMHNYNIQNNNNNMQGPMSDYHRRYGMNNQNKNIRPFRFDNQQYQDFNGPKKIF